MLGQKLVFGFHGKTLPEEFKNLLREYKIGNVILFLRNVESAEQLRALCAEIQSLVQEETGYPAFIIIDQEGGMVTRLPQDAVNVPGAMSLAATADPENARLASEITIRQLRGLGANFNMAPVLDVNSNPANPVIGVRSFGDEAERVASLGCAAIAPYAGSGVLCCAKHFPGHGDTAGFVKMIREKGIEPAVMGVEVISDEILSAGVAEAAKANFNATRAVLEQAWPEVVEQ